MSGHCVQTPFNFKFKMSSFISESLSQMFTNLRPPAALVTVHTYQNGSGFVRKLKVCTSVCGGQQARKRKASEVEDGGISKRLKSSDPVPLEDFTRVKRKLLEENNGPRKRLRVCEHKERCVEAIISSLESSEKKKKTTAATSGETSRQAFEAKYQQLNPLGAGGQGCVYAGFRREDYVPVAIKHIPRENVIYESVRKSKKMLPLEVAVMLKMAHGKEAGKSAAISLLDYYDLDQELILVLERPVPAVDLYEYMEVKEGSMQEEESRLILKQLIEAARELQSKKVFHRDIKAENILIETSTDFPRVRVIDFGLSCFFKKSSLYRIFCGTSAHIPPEWNQNKTYRASPTTVWQIGVVLYDLLHWNDRFETSSFLDGKITISKDLSPTCQDMLQLCLTKDTALRPSLEELSHHPWLA
ncbi:serine/threonine-protein kinase pim-2-like [Labrus mixtus]|uniref:serine/threonine-protein kinase pim-2-like n=1 Tax=Labrus mixtus TaxID=508554 RepID=UPI0029BFD579|nr:serine/threonine-protein kinase pim-2-like [Labrus mixtus]